MDGDTWIHPTEFRLLLKNVRWLRDWTQEELAAAAGMSVSSIYEYEKGFVPPRPTAERLLAAAGYPLELLEACLLPALTALRLQRELREQPPGPATEDFVTALSAILRSVEANLASLHTAAPI